MGEDIWDSMTSSVAAEFSRRSSSSASTKLLINITASSSTAQTRNNGVNSKLSFSQIRSNYILDCTGRKDGPSGLLEGNFRWWPRSDLKGPDSM